MPKLIAIIDDELEMEYIYSLMLEELIEQSLIEIAFFSASEDFLQWSRSHSPDLLLTDINMPLLSGPDLALRLQHEGKHFPTYFISGHEAEDYAGVMNELGIKGYLSKPLNVQELSSVIINDLDLKLR